MPFDNQCNIMHSFSEIPFNVNYYMYLFDCSALQSLI